VKIAAPVHPHRQTCADEHRHPATAGREHQERVDLGEPGTRVALARYERNIAQVQLATTRDISQEKLAHCGGWRLRLPRTQQKFVRQMIETDLAQQGR
jgi:hypothetical protein